MTAHATSARQSGYRPDIDGLRAIAVGSVLTFHAFPHVLPGGFTGVDIFFVISGYLISSILLRDHATGRFSILEFYVRRARRILPALLLVLVVTLVAGAALLLPDELEQLGKHVMSASGFISNLTLMHEAGYFDSSSDTKPLLHLWSLAIEEQFYLLWPLLLALMFRVRSFTQRGLALLTLVSFALNAYVIRHDTSAAFYSASSRGWELAMGGVLACVMMKRTQVLTESQADLQVGAGLALIAAALVLLGGDRPYPGWRALLPTVGTVLLISAGAQSRISRYVLANRAMVYVGLISYPLYLWHWPVLSLLRISQGQSAGNVENLIALSVCVLLAALTYRYIELPVRSSAVPRRTAVMLVGALALVGAVGLTLYAAHGFDQISSRNSRGQFYRFYENPAPEWPYFAREGVLQKYRHDCDYFDVERYRQGNATRIPRPAIAPACYTRDSSRPHAVFVWGDSHAQQLLYGLSRTLPQDWQLLQIVTSGCPPDIDADQPSTTDVCMQSNWMALRAIRENTPDVVLVAQKSGHSIRGFEQITARLRSLGVERIVFTGPVPHWSSELPKLIVRRLWVDGAIVQRTLVGVDRDVLSQDAALKERFPAEPGIQFVSLLDALCNSDGCLTYVGSDWRRNVTSFDTSHLTPAASVFVAERVLAAAVFGRPESDQPHATKQSQVHAQAPAGSPFAANRR